MFSISLLHTWGCFVSPWLRWVMLLAPFLTRALFNPHRIERTQVLRPPSPSPAPTTPRTVSILSPCKRTPQSNRRCLTTLRGEWPSRQPSRGCRRHRPKRRRTTSPERGQCLLSKSVRSVSQSAEELSVACWIEIVLRLCGILNTAACFCGTQIGTRVDATA